MVSDRYCSHVQDFQDLIRQVGGISGARLSHNGQDYGIQICPIYKNIIFQYSSDVPCFRLGVVVTPKIQIVSFRSQLHVKKNPQIIEMNMLGSLISKSKSYKFDLSPNNSPELLNRLFP